MYKVSVGGEFMFYRVVRFEVSGWVCGSWFPVDPYFQLYLSADSCHIKGIYYFLCLQYWV